MMVHGLAEASMMVHGVGLVDDTGSGSLAQKQRWRKEKAWEG